MTLLDTTRTEQAEELRTNLPVVVDSVADTLAPKPTAPKKTGKGRKAQSRDEVRPVTTVEPRAVERSDFDENDPVIQSIRRLYEILTYRRGKDSVTETAFVAKFLDTVPGMNKDLAGNRYVCIGDQNPSVMWSCHYDTCHHEEGLQRLAIDGEFLMLHPEDKLSSCLGADDGVGVWLMLEMIQNNVPGLYIFHYGEEKGCQGSRWLVANTPELVEGIQAAIAFDRAGYTDVITHQMTGRCCSDTFAKSLAEQLPFGYKPDDGGVYTDTAHYISLIPECTNISVGYFDQHGPTEKVNLYHLVDLREAMLKIDASKFTIARDPSVIEDDRYGGWGSYFDDRYGSGGYRGYGYSNSRGRISRSAYGSYGMLGEEDDSEFLGDVPPSSRDDQTWEQGLHRFGDGDFSFEGQERRRQNYRRQPRDLTELLQDYPVEIAAILEEYGLDCDQLWDDLQKYFG